MNSDELQPRHEKDEAIRLPYAPRPRESEARRLIRLWSSCLGRAPTALIAVILVAPILLGLFLGWFADASWLATLLIYESLFLPGALKRRSAPGVCLTLIPAGLVTMWFETDWFAWMLEWDGYRPFVELGITCVPLIALAIFEAVLRPDPPRRRVLVFVWYIVAMIAAACILEIATMYIVFSEVSVLRGNVRFRAAMFSHPLLEVSLSWFFIASVNAALTTSKRNMRLLVLGCALAPTTFVFWATGGVYWIAQRSVVEGGPFSFHYAVLLLGGRGSTEDVKTLRTALKTAHERNRFEAYGSVLYWLRQHDPPERTAGTVASLLARRPSSSVACQSAELLLQQHRYSTAPLLLRYALMGGTDCIKALEDAGEPRAAFAILMQGSEIDRDARVRLARLLGLDVGSVHDAWVKLYDQVIGQLPSPFPPDIQNECDRVVECMFDLTLARARKVEFVSWLRTGTGNTRLLSDLEAIELPDWDVVSTEDLEREVRSYESRVDELIQSHLGWNGERP